MNIHAITYTSSNAEGMQQVDIEYERGWFATIFGAKRVRSFELWPIGWRDRVTGEFAGAKDRLEIAKVLSAHNTI